jgi:hypothetical protein
MPRTEKVERREYKFPDDTYYPCVLEQVEEREVKFQKKDKATGLKTNEQGVFYKWRWKFRIIEGEFAGDLLYGESSSEFSTRDDNKIRQWSEALLGREMEIGEELDTDSMLLGLPCYITVSHGEPRKKADGEFFYPCEVDEVLPRATEPSPEDPPF